MGIRIASFTCARSIWWSATESVAVQLVPEQARFLRRSAWPGHAASSPPAQRRDSRLPSWEFQATALDRRADQHHWRGGIHRTDFDGESARSAGVQPESVTSDVIQTQDAFGRGPRHPQPLRCFARGRATPHHIRLGCSDRPHGSALGSIVARLRRAGAGWS
jgi:hypothetical protein